MKIKLLPFLAAFGAALLGGAGLLAQPAATATAVAPNPAPDRVIYLPRLPSPAELTNVATAQGLTVDRIEATGTSVLAVYRTATGQVSTVAYQLLPATATAAATVAPAAVQTVVEAPPPAVVYDDPPYGYWDYGPYAYYPGPWVWYPPVSLRLGFNYHYGFRGHGGYGHGHGWHH